VEEDEVDAQIATFPDNILLPDDPSLDNYSWGNLIDRRAIDLPGIDGEPGRLGYWLRIMADLDDDPVKHMLAMAFLSDAAPSRAARSPHPDFDNDNSDRMKFQGASLDHSVWFHRPCHADQWHWFDTRSHGLNGSRGLVTGDVLNIDGTHVATIAQEVLLRRVRD
jgi:acyl-CoA thioesterase-2